MVHAALTILRKDLRLRLRDRSVWLFAVIVPMALTMVFSLIFPSDDEFSFSAAVVDDDGGPLADAFVNGVLAELQREGLVELVAADSVAHAQRLIDGGDIAAAWVLPAGFSQAVVAGESAQAQVIHNPDRALSTSVARAIMDGFVRQLDTARLAVATTVVLAGPPATSSSPSSANIDAELLADIAERAAASAPLAHVSDLATEARRLDPRSQLGAGMAVFFVFFTATFGISGLLEEREQATLPRLAAAPIPADAIMAGKALGAFLVGMVSMVILAVGNHVLLGADWGPPLGIAVLVVATVLCATGVMALVGSFARTVEQAGNLQSIVALVFGLAGGVFFPVGATGWMAQLSLLSPHGWFIRGLGDQVGAATATAVVPAAAMLLVLGLFTGVLGAARMRKVAL